MIKMELFGGFMKKNVFILIVLIMSGVLIFNCASGSRGGAVKDGAVSGKTYDLKYDFTKMKKFSVISTSEMDEDLDVQGMIQTSTTTIGGDFGFTVKSVDGTGSGKLDMSYDDISTKLESAAGTMEVDFSQLIGSTVDFTLSPVGEASDFIGFDKLPAVESTPGRKLTAEEYINGAKDAFIMLPGKPVSIGEKWTVEINREKPVNLSSNTEYKIIGETVKDGINCLKIEGKSKVTLKGEVESLQGTLILNSMGGGTSYLYYDLNSSRIIGTEETSLMEGELEIVGMVLPWTVKSKSSSSFVYK